MRSTRLIIKFENNKRVVDQIEGRGKVLTAENATYMCEKLDEYSSRR